MANQSLKNNHHIKQYDTTDNESVINNLLKPAIGARNSLSVSMPNSEESYKSELISINLANRHIIIRRINSRPAHEELLKKKSLLIRCKYNGSDIRLSTSLIGLTGINNGEYIVNFPKTVKYLQRRNTHRVHISLSTSVAAFFVNNNGEKFTGQLRDISTNGMRVQFPIISAIEFNEQQSFTDCKIIFPDNDDIRFEFNICHLQAHATKKGCTVGGNFQEIEPYQKRTIEKFIATLERKALRGLRV